MDFEQELKSYSNFPKYSNFLASTCRDKTHWIQYQVQNYIKYLKYSPFDC